MKNDFRRNLFIYDMENRDLLVYVFIKLIKVFIVYDLVRICKNNFGQKNYGNCIIMNEIIIQVFFGGWGGGKI